MANKYTNTGLVKYLESKLGTPYVYGMDGQVLTKAKLDALAASFKSMYTKAYYNQCAKSIGKQCFDCSGSINSYIFDDGKNYNAAKDYCSSTIWQYGTNKKPIDQYKTMPIGSTVWRSGHVGTYIGNDMVIETRSAYGPGLERRKLSAGTWTHIMLHPGISYENNNGVYTPASSTSDKTKSTIAVTYDKLILTLQKRLNKAGYKDKNGKKLTEDGFIGPLTISACPTLCKGCKGNIVKSLQSLLQDRWNISVGKSGADGDFGSNTKKAVLKFQSKVGIVTDGIVGAKTWSYLTKYLK